MKKVSTAAVKASRNFSQSQLTVGLDLGDRSSCYCVLDESGRIVMEQRVSTTAKGLQAAFGEMPRSRIALETGTHSPWISRFLSELGHEVIVAHARKVRLIGESRKKDDRLDAQTLARLARIDPQLLCPVKHRSAQAQADLTVIRARAGLVRARTALVNTARSLAKSYGQRLRGCNVRNMNPEKAEGLSPELQTALEPLLASGRAWVDSDGDGKADFCTLIVSAKLEHQLACRLSKGSGGFSDTPIVSYDVKWPDNPKLRAWVDVNADGKTDFCSVQGANNEFFECALSSGRGFEPPIRDLIRQPVKP